jgi:hypothetical protein
MSASARPMWRSCSAPSQPVRAAGSVSIHARIAWMTRMSARRVMTASPPGLNARASAAMSANALRIDSARCPSVASTVIRRGRICSMVRAAGCSKRTAPQMRVVGAPPPPWRMSS